MLDRRAESLPAMDYMAGDFNCHSREWDASKASHGTTTILLVDTVTRLGLELSPPSNPGLTFVSRANRYHQSIIDLVFLPPTDVIAYAPKCLEEEQGDWDHIPLYTKIYFGRKIESITGRTPPRKQ